MLLHAVKHMAWSYHSGTFLEGVDGAGPGRRLIVVLLGGLLVGTGHWLLRHVGGEHGGDLSEAIWFGSGKLPAIQAMARAVLSIVIVGLGTAVGREGALKQTGAAIASKLSGWGHLSAPQGRLLAACGAGAGMAAAYNVPFGGAIFAVEVLLGTVALPFVLPAILCSYASHEHRDGRRQACCGY